jgi:Domain of unknown function (DUF4845)
MKKQKGVSLGGLLVVVVALIICVLFGFKIFGPYKQFYTIQKIFKTLAVNPEIKDGGRREFVAAWSKYATTERDVNVLGGDEIELTKDGNELIISASYSVRVPLVKNISLMFDFAPSSAAK